MKRKMKFFILIVLTVSLIFTGSVEFSIAKPEVFSHNASHENFPFIPKPTATPLPLWGPRLNSEEMSHGEINSPAEPLIETGRTPMPSPAGQISPEDITAIPTPEMTPTRIPITSIRPDRPAGSPVMFFEEKLFYINTGRGGFSAEERSELITERLKELYEKYRDMDVDNIRVVKYDTGVYVVYDRTKETEDKEGKLENIMMVDEEEARIAGLKPQAMGEEYAKKIREAITVHRKETSLRSIILGVVYTLIITAILILIFIISGKFLKTAEKLLNTWEGILIKDFKIQKLTVFTSERIVHTIIIILHILIFIIRIIAIYIYLALTLSFFIWTKEISDKQLDYTLDGLKIAGLFILSYLPNFFVIFLTAIITYYIIKVMYFIFNALDKGYIAFPGFYREWAMPTYKIVRFLFIVLAIIIIYPYLPGSETSAFRGISVFIGLLLSLGSSSAVSNIIAGIILTYMNAFKIGDRVKISDTTGDIIDRTLLVTHIRTIKNVDITIPNSMILSNHITNYSSSSKDLGLILNTTVTLGYDIPWRKIHKTLIDAALATEYILSDPAPFVFQTSLDDNYVSYELNAYTNEANKMANIYAELHQNIQDKCNENDIEILSPHYRAIRDGNHTSIPGDYLPKDYNPPSFRITSLKENDEENKENKKRDKQVDRKRDKSH